MSSSEGPVVRLAGVSKRYGDLDVLRGVDLDLAPHSVVAVSGPNGSGKTTLLRIIVGAIGPSGGTVFRSTRSLGYVPERFPQSLRLTARTYLRHMCRVRGVADRSREVMAALGIERFADKRLSSLSKGTCQKVAIAQATVGEPDLLVLDEPWSGLDMDGQAYLRSAIARTRNAGGCVVFTDHRNARDDVRPDAEVTLVAL